MDVEKDVLAAIKSGEVKMRPKWRFTLISALAIVAAAIVFLILVYVVSFIIFMLHETGVWFVPAFGLNGWYALFWSLPWILILFSGIFVILLALLVRKYPVAYRRPVLYSFLAILFLVAAGSASIVNTSLFREIFSAGPNETLLPFVGSFCADCRVPDPGDVHHGEVLATAPNGFVMEDLRNRTLIVLVGSTTMVREDGTLVPGDRIVVFGAFVSTDTIGANGVEQIGE